MASGDFTKSAPRPADRAAKAADGAGHVARHHRSQGGTLAVVFGPPGPAPASLVGGPAHAPAEGAPPRGAPPAPAMFRSPPPPRTEHGRSESAPKTENHPSVVKRTEHRKREPAFPTVTPANVGGRAPTKFAPAANAPTAQETSGGTDTVLSLPTMPIDAEAADLATIASDAEDIAPPVGLEVESTSPVWMSPLTAGSDVRYGCTTNVGPAWVRADKANEDFAFAVEVKDQLQETWVLVGVADGVSQSAWSARGARHASATFIEVTRELLASKPKIEGLIGSDDSLTNEIAQRFTERLLERLEADAGGLIASRAIPHGWKAELYEQRFLDGSDAAEHRAHWFETTLLAAALGPEGGFALLMGDGFARVDRRRAGAVTERKIVALQQDPRAPEARISRALTPQEVAAHMHRIQPSGAVMMGVVLATDGVSKSPDHGLETLELHNREQCTQLVDALAARPPEQVASDNMSLAYGMWLLGDRS